MSAPDDLERVLAALDGLAAGRQLDAVLAKARAAVEAGHPRVTVYLAAARAVFRFGGAAKAVELLSELSEREATRQEVSQLQVQALIELRRFPEARVAAERHLLRHPDDGATRRLLMRTREGRPSPVGVDPLVSLRRAEALAAGGSRELAVRMLRALVLAQPDDPRAREMLARIAQTARTPAGDAGAA